MDDRRQVGGAAASAAGPVTPRRAFGLALFVAGVFAGAHLLWQWLATADPRVADALAGGAMAALATALGTLPVVLSQSTSERTRDTLLGFGAGVMLAASAFSLVVPALSAARGQGAGAWGAGVLVGTAILLGAGLLFMLERWLPHEHFIKGMDRELREALRLKRTWLFVFAIALHNIPEGLAIGVAYGSADGSAGNVLATGIAIQDVPEGMVIAVALIAAGYGRALSASLGALSGLVEPVAAVLGAAVVTTSVVLLPWGLGFAAGAMLFVISHEIIPESHRQGHERHATAGLMIGFVLMTVLDTALA